MKGIGTVTRITILFSAGSRYWLWTGPMSYPQYIIMYNTTQCYIKQQIVATILTLLCY